MIDLKQAEQIAQEVISSPPFDQSYYPIAIALDSTIEKDYGWVFFYNTEICLQTGDERFALIGNVPFLVEKTTGAVHFLDTHPQVEIAIANFEASRARSN